MWEVRQQALGGDKGKQQRDTATCCSSPLEDLMTCCGRMTKSQRFSGPASLGLQQGLLQHPLIRGFPYPGSH